MPFRDDPAEAKNLRPYSAARLISVTAILISVLVAAIAGILGVSYKEALRQEMVNLRNVSIAFAAQTQSVVQAVDQAMVQAERAFRKAPQNPVIDYFEDARAAQDYIIGIHLFDNDGRPVARAAPANARLKPGYVLAPAITSGEVPRITISDVDPVSGRGILNIARAIEDAQGKRLGTILAQVDSARFERIYTLVDLGVGGSVTLFHRDGTMLVRGPPFSSGIGRSYAQTPLFTQALPVAHRGTLDIISPIDGVRRIYGYDAVSNYPLVIITGVNRDTALAAWYERLWTAVAFLVLVSLILVFLAYRVARDSARQYSLITQLAASERRAGNSAKYLASILNAVGTPIWVLDGERRLVMANDAFRRFAGCSAEELVGVPEREVLDPATAAEREQRYESVLKRLSTSEAIVEIKDGQGEPRSVIQLTSRLPSTDGETQLVSVLTDITERQKAEAHLAYLANFDTLTGLPNQNQFRRVLEEQVAIARERRGCLGTLVLSLERAHEITDLLGHEAGDTALRQIAEVLNSLLPRAACVARIKSAEFAVALHAESGNCCNTLEQFANDLLRRLSEPLPMGGRDFYLGPVIGVSVYPQDGDSAEVLYRRAESARNRGRDDGGDPVHFFSSTTHSDLDQRLTVESQLRRALERNELRIVYQPKVNIRTGRIMGFEALIRWNNALLGEISPVRFIPIAERTGLIIPIGAWVLEQTCSQIQRWTVESGAPVKVAVNLSPRQFHQKDLLTLIGDSVRRHGVRPGSLELEITETALMSREQEVDVLMRDIRRLGVELSIDDFGTGYSSLAYLKRFPVQRLKIDAAFVRDLGIDSDSAAIALTIINLAHGLKLSVIAEGVETQEQLDILRNMSCDEYQGYLFSPPVDPADVLRMLEKNRASLAQIE